MKQYLKNEAYFFHSPGVSAVIIQQEKASTLLNVIATDKEDSGNEVTVVAENVKSELKKIPSLGKIYPVLNEENIALSCSQTLQTLL